MGYVWEKSFLVVSPCKGYGVEGKKPISCVCASLCTVVLSVYKKIRLTFNIYARYNTQMNTLNMNSLNVGCSKMCNHQKSLLRCCTHFLVYVHPRSRTCSFFLCMCNPLISVVTIPATTPLQGKNHDTYRRETGHTREAR